MMEAPPNREPGIRRRVTLSRRLDIAFRCAFPGVSTAAILLLAAGPWGLPAQAALLPSLALICTFFWSLFRPASMPAALVFLLGAFTDLLGLGPVGVGALVLLTVHGIALRWRSARAAPGFGQAWLLFIAVAAPAMTLHWALSSALTWRLAPWPDAALAFALAAGLYPGAALLLARADRGVAAPERA